MNFPPFLKVRSNFCQFSKAGLLRHIPISYPEAMTYLLSLWLDSKKPSDEEFFGGKVPPSGPKSSNDDRLSDPVGSAQNSGNTDGSDPLTDLALRLELISPETPLLSLEDRHDLALLDKLN